MAGVGDPGVIVGGQRLADRLAAAEHGLLAAGGERHAETRAKFAASGARQRKRAAIEVLRDPAFAQERAQKCGTDRAADVRPALAPI